MAFYLKSTGAGRRVGRSRGLMAVLAIVAVASGAPAKSDGRVPVGATPLPRLAAGPDASTRSAQMMAETLSRRLKGTKVVAVLANGNLEPVFEENAFLVVEPARREVLRVGDMVTYEHPGLRRTVVQRLLKLSDVTVGPETPVMRVVAIIYARKNAGPMGLAAAETKPSAGPVGHAVAAAAAAR